MTTEINRYGLPRAVPSAVKREIRQRSKFGCVICRNGFYTYEHIDPLFKDAKGHDPDDMCCLCWSCQDAVTRKHLSKATVRQAYRKIQATALEEVAPPVGPLDFQDGNAELRLGSMSYYPAVRTLLRYHGVDLIRVSPGSKAGDVGSISAIFTDDSGHEILRLEENEWIGSPAAWDIEVEGARIVVRRKQGHIVLQLRLDPPGRLVVERLDMRFKDAHILATNATYAVGRYISESVVQWMHANIHIVGSDASGAAIEFTTPDDLRRRSVSATSKGLATNDGNIAVFGGVGAMLKSHGICIGSRCTLAMREWAMGARELSHMRGIVIGDPEKVPMFIGTGKTH